MSLAGLKKQLNKANQYVNEKIGGAKGTELDNEFVEIERKIDVTGKMIDEVVTKTHEYLQPNPATRARLATMNTINKIQGKAKNSLSPQPEGVLGDTMVKYGEELGDDMIFGQSLVISGEAFRTLGELKFTLEDQVKQTFLDPLSTLQNKDLKEITQHLKKLEGRRLDFDCKKRKQEKAGAKVTEDEIRQAEEKFEDTRALAEKAMLDFVNSDAEHIQSLSEFVSAEKMYHQQVAEVMENLLKVLNEKREEASKRPKKEYTPKHRISTLSSRSSATNGIHDSSTLNDSSSTPVNGNRTNSLDSKAPSAKALFDFEAENETELPFREGDIIHLIAQIDENWFEGEIRGKNGYFPVTYVQVVNPLPPQ